MFACPKSSGSAQIERGTPSTDSSFAAHFSDGAIMRVGRPGVIAAAAQTAVRLTGKPECSLNISRRAMRLVSNCSEMFTESPPCDQKTFQSMKSYRQRVNERQQRAAGPTTWLWPPPAAWRRWRRAAAALLFPFFPFFPSRPSRRSRTTTRWGKWAALGLRPLLGYFI